MSVGGAEAEADRWADWYNTRIHRENTGRITANKYRKYTNGHRP